MRDMLEFTYFSISLQANRQIKYAVNGRQEEQEREGKEDGCGFNLSVISSRQGDPGLNKQDQQSQNTGFLEPVFRKHEKTTSPQFWLLFFISY